MVSSSYTNEVQSSEMNFEPHFLFNGYQEIFSFGRLQEITWTNLVTQITQKDLNWCSPI